jgi:hypothetical protein
MAAFIEASGSPNRRSRGRRLPLFQALVVAMPDRTPLGAMGVTFSTPLVAMDLSLTATRPAALHPNRYLNYIPR